MITPQESGPLKISDLTLTLVSAILVVLMFAPRFGAALVLPVLLVPTGVGILYRYFKSNKFSSARRLEKIRAVIWASVAILIAGCHSYYYFASRVDAQRLANKVLSYHKKHGSYPPSTEVLGEDRVELDRAWMLGYAIRSNGTPYIIYAATYMPFKAYSFDFKSNKWVVAMD